MTIFRHFILVTRSVQAYTEFMVSEEVVMNGSDKNSVESGLRTPEERAARSNGTPRLRAHYAKMQAQRLAEVERMNDRLMANK